MKIVILDGRAANPGDLCWNGLGKLGELIVYEQTTPDKTVERALDADIVLTNKVCLHRKEIEQLPRLRYIGVLATGYNVVDIEAAIGRGIVVTNVPAYSTESVAQMVFAHLLAVTNRVEHYACQNRKGRWAASADFCYCDTDLTELNLKTFGIVGLGHIGSRVASIANAFGMDVAAFTSKPADKLPTYVRKCSLHDLFSHSDFITLHCPLTPDTRHLINGQTLNMMKSSAILINTGRGQLVDEDVLAEFLHARRLRAYCADVLCDEPPTNNNPLLKCENAFITPHIAWATAESRSRLVATAINNVKAFVEGNPQNIIKNVSST